MNNRRSAKLVASIMAAALFAPGAGPRGIEGGQVAQQGPQSKGIPLSAAAQVAAPIFNMPSPLHGGLAFQNAKGCPWPGRRAACARRRSGRTNRMR